MNTSKFNIFIPTKQSGKTIMVNGCTGAFDIADENICVLLKNAEQNPSILDEIEEDNRSILERRGYITNRSKEEEEKTRKVILSGIKKINLKSLTLTFIPTYNCNFRCSYCFEKNIQEKGAEWMNPVITKETVDITYQYLKDQLDNGKSLTSIILFGGEPLLKNNKEIVEYIITGAQQLNVPVSAVTNGYDLLSYKDLIGKNKLSSLQITIDGPEDIHNSRRYLAGKQGTLKKIRDNINAIIDMDIELIVRSNVNKLNIDSIGELIDMYRTEGWLNKSNFHYYFKSTHKCYEKEEDSISDVELIDKLKDYFTGSNVFNYSTIYQSISKSVSDMINKKGYAPFKSGYCGANNGMYTVDPYGDVYTCWDVIGNKDLAVGSVDYENRTIILNDKLNQWLDRRIDNMNECSECKYALFCGGGCTAHANVTTGDFNMPYCQDYIQIFNEVVMGLYDDYDKQIG